MSRIRALIGIAVAIAAFGLLPAYAQGRQIVKIKVGFSPNVLGGSSSILFGFRVSTPNGEVPSPTTSINLRLPKGAGMGNLGLATCTSRALELWGHIGCPSNALMGLGTAWAEAQFGQDRLVEEVHIWTFMGPPINNHTGLVFDVEGYTPVFDTAIFSGQLLSSNGAFGANLDTVIPLQTTVPGGPYASVFRMESSFGPKNVTYYKYEHGKRIGYEPEGMTIPNVCPRGGFPFVAVFAFQDGTTATAKSAAPCPPRSH